MVRGKRIRQKGKIKLSEYYKKIENGARVSIVADKGIRRTFPKRLGGKTGKTKEDRGKFKLVEIKEGDKLKTFIIHPIHLKKLK